MSPQGIEKRKVKMDIIKITGLAAGILTTVSFLPQMIKVHRTKHTKDLSLYMYFIFSLGVTLWFVYGIMLKEYPIVIANFVALFFALYILCMKIKYK